MRLGVIGSDNSHAAGFSRLVNIDKAFGEDVQVVALWGAVLDQAEQVARTTGIDEVVASPDALAGKVDAAIVVDRDGALHYEHAVPLIEAGCPLLIDKPLATSVRDAEAILDLARARGVAVTSFSSLRWCEGTRTLQAKIGTFGRVRTVTVSGPCDLNSPYGGHFFYGIHLAEIALAICPGRIETVAAVRGSLVTTVVAQRDDGATITLHLVHPGPPGTSLGFQAAVLGTAGSGASDIQREPDLRAAMDKFLRMVQDGRSPLSYAEMVEPIRLLEMVKGALHADGSGSMRPETVA